MNFENCYQRLTAAFVRGRFRQGDSIELTDDLLKMDLDGISESQFREIFQAGQDAGLRLHKFKRTMQLPRVNRILGELRGLVPENLLDIGSGRGAFLWPLLNEFSQLPVTSIDVLPQRVSDLQAVRLGGVDQLQVDSSSVTDMPFEDGSFDVVTALEVLEHVTAYRTAINQIARVAKRFVLVTVPSKPDDNPEHIHVLTRSMLQDAFEEAGCHSVRFDSVRNHLIAIAKVT